nr:PREDICTED: ATPase WRNIP1-like [Latimeria chalumnae]|eukprot:XP_006008093.1 PREDICTED: ATPase WRNIP1-like [Latimeria chalumnae]
MALERAAEPETLQCPVCSQEVEAEVINFHLDGCLQQPGAGSRGKCLSSTHPEEDAAPSKKMRVSSSSANPSFESSEKPQKKGGSCPLASSVFPLFHRSRGAEEGGSQAPLAKADENEIIRMNNKALRRSSPGEGEPLGALGTSSHAPAGVKQLESGQKPRAEKFDCRPLADKMRPATFQEYVGQNKVLGESTLLRSLLESNEIPSLMLWGPPGCGKTTLAHIIANKCKKNGGTRFVTLSATSASTNDVREIIKQAQNEQRLFKRKTILFVDEIHRFNKTQQDTFLPHVECGTITLIGATTENPSFQVNAALLSRCRVIVLEKLSVEAMETILARAIDSLGIRVFSQDEDTGSVDEASSSEASELH